MTHSISIIKAVTYRLLGSSVTFAISYVMTGSIMISGAISVTEFTVKPFTYYLHERAWVTLIRKADNHPGYYERRARWGN